MALWAIPELEGEDAEFDHGAELIMFKRVLSVLVIWRQTIS